MRVYYRRIGATDLSLPTRLVVNATRYRAIRNFTAPLFGDIITDLVLQWVQ